MSKKQKSIKEQIIDFIDNEPNNLWRFVTYRQREELAESLTRLFRRILRRKKNG